MLPVVKTIRILSVFGVSYEAFNADPYVISDAQFAAAAEATTLPIGRVGRPTASM